jgi:CheY-like chemotaxis protein
MDARKRLESIYKRRVEESDVRKVQAELDLHVMKIYMMISVRSGNENSQMIHSLIQYTQKLLDNLKIMSQNSTSEVNNIWKDAIHLSRLELDKISYTYLNLSISNVVSDIKENLTHKVELLVPAGKCIQTDPLQLRKVLVVLADLFKDMLFHTKVTVRYDHPSKTLQISLTELSGRFSMLETAVATTNMLLDSNIRPDMVITDEIAKLFVCKTLAQGLGDLVLNDSTRMTMYLHSELYDEYNCPPPSQQSNTKTPVSTPIHQDENELKPKSIANKNVSILLAEDDPILQQMFKRYFTREPRVTVSIASDGVEAIKKFKQQNYSIIFIDIDMPYKNGIEVAKHIRQYEKDNHITPTPIIGVSGFTERHYKEQALAAGMNDFVNKGTAYQLKDIHKMVIDYVGDRVE